MKIYGVTVDLASPSAKRIAIPQDTRQYGLAVKALLRGLPLAEFDARMEDGGAAVLPEKTMDDGSRLFAMTSVGSGSRRTSLSVSAEGRSAKVDLWLNETKTAFPDADDGEGGGSSQSPVVEELERDQFMTRVEYQDTATRTYVLSSFDIRGTLTRESFEGTDVAGHNIREVDVGTGVSAIGPGALSGMVGLDYVHLPKTVKSIGERAFQGSHLARLDWEQEFGNQVGATPAGTSNQGGLSVGAYAFKDCSNLARLQLPFVTKMSLGEGWVENANFLTSNANKIYGNDPGIHFSGYYFEEIGDAAQKLYNIPAGSPAYVDAAATQSWVNAQGYGQAMKLDEDAKFAYSGSTFLFRCLPMKSYSLSVSASDLSATTNAVRIELNTPQFLRSERAQLNSCRIDMTVASDVVWPVAPVAFRQTGSGTASVDARIGLDGKPLTQEQVYSLFFEPGTRRIWSIAQYAKSRYVLRLEAEIEG